MKAIMQYLKQRPGELTLSPLRYYQLVAQICPGFRMCQGGRQDEHLWFPGLDSVVRPL